MSDQTPEQPGHPGVAKPLSSPRYKDETSTSGTGKFKKLKKQVQWGSITAGMALIGLIGGGVLATQGVGKAAAQEQIAPVKADTEVNKQQLAFLQAQFQLHLADEANVHAREEAKIDKQEANQQVIMDALHVPQWRRPEPVVFTDAGTKDAGR